MADTKLSAIADKHTDFTKANVRGYVADVNVPITSKYFLQDEMFDYISGTLIVIPIAAAASQLDADLGVATSQAIFAAPYAMTIKSVFAHVGTAPTGSSILVDINKNGVSILLSTLSIAASSKNSSVDTPNTTSLAQQDEITVDIDQVGATVAGKDLTVYILAVKA
jgi:hypothetical protein